MRLNFSLVIFSLFSLIFLTYCGKEEGTGNYTVVKDVKVGPFNPELAAKGEQIFKMKCSSCHQYDKRLVGPPLRDIAKKRRADYIISMIIAPEVMQEKTIQSKL